MLEERVGTGNWTEAYAGERLSKAYAGRPAGTYAYRVKACNPAGCGAFSQAQTVEAFNAPAIAPTLSAPSHNVTGTYTMTWTAVGGAASYRLEERLGSGVWNLVHNGTAGTFGVTGRSSGQYSYRVAACDHIMANTNGTRLTDSDVSNIKGNGTTIKASFRNIRVDRVHSRPQSNAIKRESK